jgi:hypothetical protein
LEEIGVGGSFGEAVAFVGIASDEIVAEEDSLVLLLGHDLVEQLASRVPAFAFAAARGLAARVVAPQPVPRATRPTGSPSSAASGEVRFVRASSYEPSPQVLGMVPAKLIYQHRLLPLELRDKTLLIGMVDPLNSASRTELSRGAVDGRRLGRSRSARTTSTRCSCGSGSIRRAHCAEVSRRRTRSRSKGSCSTRPTRSARRSRSASSATRS